MKEPILGSRTVYDKEWGGSINLRVRGGLHFIKANSKPYFSLTCDIYQRGRDVGGGAAHDLILRHFPKLKPLADLHLSDIDGVPMHDASNAWYWVAGADAELGANVEYHGGSGSDKRTPEQCLEIFAKHVRVSLNEARGVVAMLLYTYRSVSQYKRVYEGAGTKLAKEALATWVEHQKPRWKREADECTASLHLKVFGDALTREQELAWETNANQEEA